MFFIDLGPIFRPSVPNTDLVECEVESFHPT